MSLSAAAAGWMLLGPHSIWYPLIFSVRMTPPGRDDASRITASIPSFLSVHAHDRPLIPAPTMMTSAIPVFLFLMVGPFYYRPVSPPNALSTISASARMNVGLLFRAGTRRK